MINFWNINSYLSNFKGSINEFSIFFLRLQSLTSPQFVKTFKKLETPWLLLTPKFNCK